MWKSEFSAETAASPEAVWQVLAGVEGWPTWNPGYTAAHLDGPLQSGAQGSIKLPRGPSRPFTVYEVDPQRSLTYGGDVPGGRQRFLNRIEPLGPSRTRITLGHTIEGWTWPLFGVLFGRIIRGYLPTALKQLVAMAEATPTVV